MPSPGAPPIVVPDPTEPIPQPAPGTPPIVVPDPTEPMPEPMPQPAPPEPTEPEPRPLPPVLMAPSLPRSLPASPSPLGVAPI